MTPPRIPYLKFEIPDYDAAYEAEMQEIQALYDEHPDYYGPEGQSVFDALRDLPPVDLA